MRLILKNQTNAFDFFQETCPQDPLTTGGSFLELAKNYRIKEFR